MEFLEEKAQVGASSQALMAVKHSWLSDYSQYPSNITGLHLGAYFGLKGEAQVLLSQGHNPNSKDSHGQTLPL
jgi:hypothetical protein